VVKIISLRYYALMIQITQKSKVQKNFLLLLEFYKNNDLNDKKRIPSSFTPQSTLYLWYSIFSLIIINQALHGKHFNVDRF